MDIASPRTGDIAKISDGMLQTAIAPGPASGVIVDHHGWMQAALTLARSMRGSVWPNPPVGCVIVRDNQIVAHGRTQPGGRPHAERVALDQAGDAARGATLYVTLEPCCHYGKTPPCADAIIAAGVTAVYASIQDPDPRVNGGGFRKLLDAGIYVHVGLGAVAAQSIMKGFFHRVTTGQPLVVFGPPGLWSTNIPKGCDALLRGGEDGIILVYLRASDGQVQREVIAFDGGKDRLLNRLGELGLTEIYVPESDPLAALLRPVAEA